MALSNDDKQRALHIAKNCSGMSNSQLARAAQNAANAGDKSAAYGFLGAMKVNADKRKADYEQYTSGGGCFVTTAVCGSFGKPDDCYELTMFRKFRDGWLKNQSDGERLIARYYDIAPSIVEHINQLPNAREIYRDIWDKYLRPCLSCLEQGNHQACKDIYVNMVETLAVTY